MVGGVGLGGLKLDWRLCGCLVNVIHSDRSDYRCRKWIRARVSHLVLATEQAKLNTASR